jgi:hypothetical protein
MKGAIKFSNWCYNTLSWEETKMLDNAIDTICKNHENESWSKMYLAVMKTINLNFASRDYAPSGNSEKTAVPQDSYSRFKRTAGTATAIKNRKEEIDEENLFEGEEPVSKKGNTAVREGVKDGVNKSNIITVVLVLILVIAIGILYTVGYMGFKGRYLKNTFVNGVNIGGVKIGEADELIASGAETSGITVVKGDGEEVHFDGNQFGCKYSVPAGTRYGEEKHKFWFKCLEHDFDKDMERIFGDDKESRGFLRGWKDE